MIAVVLAAGMATRLRPLTDTVPKCLLKIGERTLMERTVDALVSAGVTRLVVVTGYREAQIRTFLLERYPTLSLHFIHNEAYQTTNNIYSLWLAKPVADGNPFLLLDSDILFDPQLLAALTSGKGSSLAVNRHTLGDEEMKVVVNPRGDITQLTKTCDPQQAIGESVGIEYIDATYSTALFRELNKMMTEEHLENVFYEKAFERLIPKGHSFRVVDTTRYFSVELDTVEDFNHAGQLIPPHLY
ncbi:phosphocholine cytidylyltransferase family protein [Hoylesella marshii]|uniref:MobA-like NTP transferase domain-containing protein n=1 Tax=Hoylesella marshii DSM 16973 = JCM 13450 TaxID=862515 RepID=E0NU34_9BACT|nr:phosphocholine cytidylyltransferase family protein [Hoylesella marshii]EFM01567.1 hypothetical protein HMPREF0658_1687 [Hoylesella marshii DSM 16973 = JCM 13450]